MSLKFALLPFVLLAVAIPGLATQTESVTINTSSLPANTQGFLDLFYNGGPSSPAASVSINGFSTNGSLSAAGLSRTNSTGQFPSAVTLTNNNSEYLEGITFGSSISFQLAFAEPAYGSLFTLSLLNSTQDGSYLTSNINDGYLFTLSIDNQGPITPTFYTTETGAPSVVSIAPLAGVPEPATFAVCGLAMLALMLLCRVRASR